MKNQVLVIAFILLFLSSCIVQSPKYSTLDKVISLQLGMSKVQVEEILGVQPYNLKAYTDTSNVFIYVYRLTDRRTLSVDTKPVNGKKALGKYVQLAVTYSMDGKVISMESCILCPDNLVTTSKIDFEKVMVFVTVTLPVLLVYFGLKK
jgi:outer membrane protein assembly factor BamE (lipoprotein component of BamABCDE complex)